MNGKFHASNGDQSLWISDAHCTELCIDLDETVWKPDGSGLDKSDLMRGHLFDELRYVVQARYPINAKHRGGTFTKARRKDQFDMDRRNATVPQISAPLTFEAYCNNIDPALEAIRRAEEPKSSCAMERGRAAGRERGRRVAKTTR